MTPFATGGDSKNCENSTFFNMPQVELNRCDIFKIAIIGFVMLLACNSLQCFELPEQVSGHNSHSVLR